MFKVYFSHKYFRIIKKNIKKINFLKKHGFTAITYRLAISMHRHKLDFLGLNSKGRTHGSRRPVNAEVKFMYCIIRVVNTHSIKPRESLNIHNPCCVGWYGSKSSPREQRRDSRQAGRQAGRRGTRQWS
jgi:hypothetical protein